MNGIHDMGGMQDLGPVQHEKNEPVFHARWEARWFALPYSYFVRTMADFKNGLRKSSAPRKVNTNNMIRLAANMTDDEVKAAAIYFSSMKWTPWIRVVETSAVPKTRVQFGMFLKLEGFTNIRGGLSGRKFVVPIR